MSAATGIAVLAIIVAAAVIAAVRRPKIAFVIAFVMSFQLALAAAGLLRHWDRTPPPIMPVLAGCFLLTVMLAFSRTGAATASRLSLAALIGWQAFRLPLELVMHHAVSEGLMPVQMSYSGCNFDILTGITAIPLAFLTYYGRAPRWLLIAWNTMGSLLLAVVIGIAIASAPMFAAFGPDRLNTWVADPPFIWLPGILVPAALLGHVLLWRKMALR